MNTADTLAQMREALNKSFTAPISDPRMPDGLMKSTFSQSGSAISGLTFYDLELGAKFLYPVLTPLRNMIPRVSGKGGIQANWRAITKINSSGVRIGVSGGNRGAAITVQTTDYTAAYKGIGLEASADFEAQYAGMGFDDVRSIAAETGLQSLMLGEELIILGGNGAQPLGVPATPILATSTTGGTLATALAIRVFVVALSLEGFVNSSLVGGIPLSITRTNADGSSDTFGGGSSNKSAVATVTTGGTATNSITAAVTAVPGAVGYAWFTGLAGSEVLTALTNTNAATFIATGVGTQNVSTVTQDNSANSLIFDGILTQATKAGSGAYVQSLDNATLTADNAGGVKEIDAALKFQWDTNRLSPDCIWVNSQQALDISRKILAGGTASNYRFNASVQDGMIGGGVMVTQYLNRFSMAGGAVIPIKIHPNLPAGTILMTCQQLPYPLSNVSNVMQIRTRQDYYQIEWPLRSRKYEYGIYADEVFQHYFPTSLSVIQNVAAG